MTGDYTIHQVWDTTPLSKMGDRLIQTVSSGDVFYNCVLLPPENNAYRFVAVMLRPEVSGNHSVQFTIRCIGKKAREFKETHVFSKDDKYFFVPEFLPLTMVNQYAKKDRLSIDITIQHKEAVADLPDYRKITGYVGLNNQAATCYMNSILEMLFHTPAFRRLIYGIESQESHAVVALQHLFCLLQLSPVAATTEELTKSFGWNSADAFYQHDVQEFVRVLLSKLEEKIKNTPLDGQIADLFRGKTRHYVKCVNVDYESTHEEEFYDIALVVQGKKNIEESLDGFVEEEFLTGDNQYKVDGKGPQDAVMGCKISQLPPVLHFHLARFAYSPTSIIGMEKVRDRFEFGEVLDMSRYCENKSQDAVYELFSVLVHLGNNMGGHYIAYCRPTEEKRWFKFNDSQVEEVSVSEVTEKNFGGPNQVNHAYYLCYVKRSEIPWVMEQIQASDIPVPLLDYYEAKRDELDPKMMTVTITNAPGTPKIRFGKMQTIDALMKEVKKTVQDCKSLWTVDVDGMPLKYLPPKAKLGEEMKGGRIFAAPFPVGNSLKNPCAFLLKFFFKGRQQPLQTLGYEVVSSTDRVDAIFPRVSALAGFPNGTSYECFREFHGTVTKFKTDAMFVLQCRSLCSGTLIFQLSKESEGVETKYSFPEEPAKDETFLRVRDMIPGIPLDTAERFLNHIKRCIQVVVNDMDDKKLVTVEIPDMMKLAILIRCIRNGLKVPDTDGVALYLPNPREPTKPTDILLNSLPLLDIRKAFNMRGQPKSVKVFARILPVIPHADTDKRITIRVAVLDDVFNVIGDVLLELPGDGTAELALEETRRRLPSIPSDMPLRVVAVSKASILGILQPTDKIADFRHNELRVEYVPENQRDLTSRMLLKCAFSNNYNYPPYGCVLSPFYVNIDKDEPFELTQCRIDSLIETNLGEMDYVLYLGRNFTKRFVTVTSDTVLYDLATEPDAELFLMIKPETMMRLYQNSLNRDLKIND